MKLSIRFCGPKCSSCCLVLSTWGVVMLLVLGILFKVNSLGLLEDTKNADESATNCFIAAALYGACIAISLWQKWLRKESSSSFSAVSDS